MPGPLFNFSAFLGAVVASAPFGIYSVPCIHRRIQKKAEKGFGFTAGKLLTLE